jgi:hypothetical protein
VDTVAVIESCLPPMFPAGNFLPLLSTLTARIFKNISKNSLNKVGFVLQGRVQTYGQYEINGG